MASCGSQHLIWLSADIHPWTSRTAPRGGTDIGGLQNLWEPEELWELQGNCKKKAKKCGIITKFVGKIVESSRNCRRIAEIAETSELNSPLQFHKLLKNCPELVPSLPSRGGEFLVSGALCRRPHSISTHTSTQSSPNNAFLAFLTRSISFRGNIKLGRRRGRLLEGKSISCPPLN